MSENRSRTAPRSTDPKSVVVGLLAAPGLLYELASSWQESCPAFCLRVSPQGNLRLVIGMLRANRPWRVIAGLSRALVATGA